MEKNIHLVGTLIMSAEMIIIKDLSKAVCQ
jgi:hypothetical protein